MRRKLVFCQTVKKRDTLDGLMARIDKGLSDFKDATFERTEPLRIEQGSLRSPQNV